MPASSLPSGQRQREYLPFSILASNKRASWMGDTTRTTFSSPPIERVCNVPSDSIVVTATARQRPSDVRASKLGSSSQMARFCFCPCHREIELSHRATTIQPGPQHPRTTSSTTHHFRNGCVGRVQPLDPALPARKPTRALPLRPHLPSQQLHASNSRQLQRFSETCGGAHGKQAASASSQRPASKGEGHIMQLSKFIQLSCRFTDLANSLGSWLSQSELTGTGTIGPPS